MDGGRVAVLLKESPFYAESGGQISDEGEIVGDGWRIDVDGVRKIEGTVRRRAMTGAAAAEASTTRAPVAVKLFSSPQLDLALGRTNVIHAALATGPVSTAFLTRCQRLRIYRSEASPEVDAVAEAEPA